MHAMVLKKLQAPLEWTELPDRQPGPHEIRVKVLACGVCRTDLHVVDGELPDPKLPIIPGHEIVGRIDAMGAAVKDLRIGERVGIPWLGHTDGTCPYCLMQRENLCDHPLFTGFTRDGGYATSAIADARFAFPLGEVGDDISIAPLLCAGLIGWRSLLIAGEAKKIGFYGFGAAAHILTQAARWQGSLGLRVYQSRRCTQANIRQEPRRGLGWRLRRITTGATRCRDHLRAGWRSGPKSAASRSQGRPGGLRRRQELKVSQHSSRSPLHLVADTHARISCRYGSNRADCLAVTGRIRVAWITYTAERAMERAHISSQCAAPNGRFE